MNHRDSKLKDMLSGCHQLPLSWILYQTPESKEYRDLQRQYKYGRIDEYTWPDYENFHSAWMAAEELYAKKDKHEVVTEKEESKVWQALAEELNVKVGCVTTHIVTTLENLANLNRKMFLEEFTKLVSKNYDSDTCHQKAWDEIRRSFT